LPDWTRARWTCAHISATGDLHAVVSNFYPIKKRTAGSDLVVVVIAHVVALRAVLLFEIPLNVILPDLFKLLF
jgi:hypothetical protein